MNLERRVRCLEAENRRLKRWFVLVLVGVGSVFLMGQGAAVSEQVKARRFSLVDPSGKTLVDIRPEGPAGAAIVLADNRGGFEIALRTKADSAEISVTDKKTKTSATLEASKDGRWLAFRDKTGVVADLGTGAQGPTLVLYGPAGEALMQSGGEGPSVSTTNAQGQPVWRRP